MGSSCCLVSISLLHIMIDRVMDFEENEWPTIERETVEGDCGALASRQISCPVVQT